VDTCDQVRLTVFSKQTRMNSQNRMSQLTDVWLCFQVSSADLSRRWRRCHSIEFWREAEASRSKAGTNTTDCW
jgi:hypothetical protein